MCYLESASKLVSVENVGEFGKSISTCGVVLTGDITQHKHISIQQISKQKHKCNVVFSVVYCLANISHHFHFKYGLIT